MKNFIKISFHVIFNFPYFILEGKVVNTTAMQFAYIIADIQAGVSKSTNPSSQASEFDCRTSSFWCLLAYRSSNLIF